MKSSSKIKKSDGYFLLPWLCRLYLHSVGSYRSKSRCSHSTTSDSPSGSSWCKRRRHRYSPLAILASRVAAVLTHLHKILTPTWLMSASAQRQIEQYKKSVEVLALDLQGKIEE